MQDIKLTDRKSLTFLYTNNEKTERETKETIPFTIAMKRIKYLGITLPKETKDIYIYIYTYIYIYIYIYIERERERERENYKTLMKEIKEDTNRWRSIL